MLTSLLDRAAAMSVEAYDPLVVIDAVNALQPLGKEEALGQIVSFLERRDRAKYPAGLFWVLRVLFDVPEGQGFPPVVMGAPDIPPPADQQKLPRYPIVILRDVPFLVVGGYLLFGLPGPIEPHIDHFRRYGTVRERPLTPASLDGLDEEFRTVWKAAYGDAYAEQALQTIRAQCLKLGTPAR